MSSKVPFLVVACLAFGGALPASAETAGFAYDTYTRTQFQKGTSAPALPTPAPFDAVFTRASQPVPKASGVPASPFSGGVSDTTSATRHFVLGSRERIDDVTARKSTIRDCAANTVTSIDHVEKTYSIAPIASTPSRGPGSATPAPAATANAFPFPLPSGLGVTLKVIVATRHIEAATIDGQKSDGFQADVKLYGALMAPLSSNLNATVVGYFSSYPTAQARLACPTAATEPPSNPAMPFAIPLSFFSEYHIELKYDGPLPPFEKLPSFAAASALVELPKPVGANLSGSFVTQNGHFRALTDADGSLFSVPAGYTQSGR